MPGSCTSPAVPPGCATHDLPHTGTISRPRDGRGCGCGTPREFEHRRQHVHDRREGVGSAARSLCSGAVAVNGGYRTRHGHRIPPSVIQALKSRDGAVEAQAKFAPYQVKLSQLPILSSKLS
ncbi:hypothetical protein DL764_004455 [Monosporascus ibericus]|uniref:Uncharacterized protein n=1 Tax=Monosporascus ibericus TaxID=155417 RepID=A0A4Q4TFC2_9PEZI|nr:hypothetical protein DL764_004455 [Monosporascus ibericus]